MIQLVIQYLLICIKGSACIVLEFLFFLQVLVNFITNAIKYAPDSDKILVNASKISDSEIRISVKDFGPGIAEEKLKHLFNRYYRTDYKVQNFTGLGL